MLHLFPLSSSFLFAFSTKAQLLFFFSNVLLDGRLVTERSSGVSERAARGTIGGVDTVPSCLHTTRYSDSWSLRTVSVSVSEVPGSKKRRAELARHWQNDPHLRLERLGEMEERQAVAIEAYKPWYELSSACLDDSNFA